MDKSQQQVMETFGYRIETLPNLKTVPRMTFYNKEGIPLANLPADAYHMKRYLSRGFTLTPPEQPQPGVSVVEEKPKVRRKHHKRKYTPKQGE